MKINTTNSPEIYILIGLPGSGKSTWVNEMLALGSYAVISTDDELERIAVKEGLDYNSVFTGFYKTAERIAKQKFRDALANSENIIWDQTNMTVNKRKSILNQLPKRYKKTAVTFIVDRQELDRRLQKRFEETGKNIPKHVVDDMCKRYEPPTLNEGFDDLIKR